MKVTLVSSALADALAVAGHSVSTDKTSPTVGCVLVAATPDGGLTLTGDDTPVRSWMTVPADVEQSGAICLKKAALDGFLESLEPFGDVGLTVDAKGRAQLVCGPTTVKVAGIDAEGFPAAPKLDDREAEFSLDASAFTDLVGSVVFAADSKPDNSVRDCVHIVTRGGQIIFEATDGLRVARRRMLPLGELPDLDIVVPAPGLKNAAALAGTKGIVRLVITPTHMRVDSEAIRVAVARSTGQFPDVDRIVPKERAARVTVNRAVLDRALKLVLHVEKTEKGYRVDLEIADATMTLTASDRSSDHEARTAIAIDLEGEPTALTMTATHLSQALGALAAFDQIEISLQSPRHPVVVRGVGDEDGDRLHILMPIVAGRK